MSSTGSNKIEDVFKARGTYRLTPLSGVSGGGAVVTATATGGIVTVSVTAAKILLDSSPFTFPLSPLATSVLPDGVSNFAVYINPIRQVPAVTVLPTGGTTGDLVMLVSPTGKYDSYLQDIYQYNGVSWVTRDSAIGANLDPNKPYAPLTLFTPGTSDFRNLPFNKITGGVLGFSDEPTVIYPINRGVPANLPGMGGEYARYSTGFTIAKVKVTLTGGAIANPVTDLIVTRPASVDLFF